MGEPLNNYEQVRTATRSMINPTLFGLKRSKVTISTVGIIPRILQVHISSFQDAEASPDEETTFSFSVTSLLCAGQ